MEDVAVEVWRDLEADFLVKLVDIMPKRLDLLKLAKCGLLNTKPNIALSLV
jgi:hypothetical protein